VVRRWLFWYSSFNRDIPGGEEDNQKGTGIPDLKVRYSHRANLHLHGDDSHIIVIVQEIQYFLNGNLKRNDGCYGRQLPRPPAG
jgi:hypothetical protein